MTTISETREYLEQIEALRKRTVKMEGVTSPYGYILEHGREWGPRVFPTWAWKGKSKYGEARDYFGVEIPIDKLHKIMLKTGVYGVFGNWMQWEEVLKILKG